MKICVVSDLHGHLPAIQDCDLLLLAGDYIPGTSIPYQEHWLRSKFEPWLVGLAERNINVIGIAGNHDLVFEKRDLVPPLTWTYLEDSGTEFRGLKIYGTPWQPRFFDWAFNADEEYLDAVYSNIPSDTDILLTHSPPFSILDFSPYPIRYTNAGSRSLWNHVVTRIRPKLHVFGHIHAARGYSHIDNTLYINCAHVTETYEPYGSMFLVDTEHSKNRWAITEV